MKRIVTSLFIVFTLSIAVPQAQTNPELLFPLQDSEYDRPLAVDYDWNGDLDYLSPKGVVYLNPWTPQSDWMLTNIQHAFPQYAHDFSGDGIPDIICSETNYTDAFVDSYFYTAPQQFFLALGGGNQMATIIPLNIATSFITSEDVDGDGDYDIILNHDILYNDGSANFTAVNLASVNFLYKSSDIDGDGLRDITLRNFNQTTNSADFFWRKNLGSSFDVEQSLIFNIPISLQREVGFWDYDNDMDADVVFLSNEEVGAAVFLHEGNGSGTFVQTAFVTTLDVSVIYGFINFQTTDVEGDGDLDMAIGSNYLLINGGDGSISLNDMGVNGLGGTTNGDICQFYETPSSLFGGMSQTGFLGYMFNCPNTGSFPLNAEQAFVYANLSDVSLSFIEDMDNDGEADVVLGSGSGSWSYLQRTSDTKLSYHLGMVDFDAYNFLDKQNLGAEDLDNNGAMNFVAMTAALTSNSMEFPNTGFVPASKVSTGMLADQDYTTIAGLATRLNFYDLNSDGFADALFQQQSTAGSYIYNVNTAVFDPIVFFTMINPMPGTYLYYDFPGYAYVDFNADGLMDVFNPAYRSVLMQGAAFVFDEVPCFDNSYDPNDDYFLSMNDDPEVADLNGDGFDDVVGHGFLFMNDAGVQFNTTVLTTNPTNAFSELWDYDNDGDLDIILSETSIAIIENLGGGAFADAVIAPFSAYFYDASVMDWDNDGDDELIFTGQKEGQKGIFVWGTVGATNIPASIAGNLYVDDNANGIFDSGEPPLPNRSVQLTSPNSTGFHYSNSNGQYQFDLLNADDYDLSVSTLYTGIFTPTTPQTTITIAEGDNAIVDFGYTSSIVGTYLTVDHCPGFVGCNLQTALYLMIGNWGATTPDATVTWNFSPNITVMSTSITPLSQAPGQIVWSFQDIERYTNQYITVDVQYPNQTFAGTLFTSTVTVDVTDDLSAPLYTSTSNNVMTCAFDPNDIQELTGFTDQLYVNGTNPLDYLIRFQNTGSAEAIDVRIEDQLPASLNWATLQPTMWSHDLTDLTIDETGRARFVFNNINLPDSATDMIGSQGFVRFSILPHEGLSHGETIENVVGIFFDLNEPVITNTVVNHIFDCNTFNAQFEATGGVDCFHQHAEMNYNPEWAEEVLWIVDDIVTSNENQIEFTNITEDFSLALQASNPLCGTVTQEAIISAQEIIQPQIQASDTEFCDGNEAILSSNFDINNEWYLNNNLLSTNNTLSVDASGDYVLIVHDGDCMSDAITQTITVNAPPAAPEITSVAAVLSTADVSGLTYQWYLNGEMINGATTSNYTAMESGMYTLTITDENGCSASSASQSVVIGVNEIGQNRISIYPNPASDIVKISFSDASKKDISIYAPEGRLIERITAVGLIYELNISELAAGHYYLTIISNDKIENKILVVE